MTWPLNGSEAGDDLVLIQTRVKSSVLMLNSLPLRDKSEEVCIKAGSPPASLAFKGQPGQRADNCKMV